MKAQNYKTIQKAIISFTLYLVASVVMATCFLFFFIKTSSAEVSKILEKVKDYDSIQSVQLDLKEKADSLYYYAYWLTIDPTINYRLMQNVLSERNMQFSNTLSTLPEKDGLLYRKLADQMTLFFQTKDSLMVATAELNSVRSDLMRCIDDNRKVTRRMSIGGLTIEQ